MQYNKKHFSETLCKQFSAQMFNKGKFPLLRPAKHFVYVDKTTVLHC